LPLIPLVGLAHASCVIAGDTTAHAKPHPEPLFEAARRIGLEAQECWYVGDDLRDMQAARAAGMFSVAAAWGYCADSDPVTWQADHIIAAPADLLELIA
jgi:phosphoglycolate phosphatase-like HAD superfamily hydrolase